MTFDSNAGGIGGSTARSDADALEALLTSRRSCRSFRADPVPRETIERVLAMAARTPSWCNTQPWHLTITEGDATGRFAKALTEWSSQAPPAPDFSFPEKYQGDYLSRRRESAWQLYESAGIERGDRAASAAQTAKNFSFFGAPHVAIVTSETDLGVYGAVDCGLYIDSFLLGAESMGLGAIPQAALAVHSDFIRNYFGMPATRQVVCGISFGLPDLENPVNQFRTSRVSVEEMTTWVD